MLDPSLDNFLDVAVTPEMYKLYKDIISLLENMDYDNVQNVLIDIMFASTGDDIDRVQKPDNTICDEIREHLTSTLTDLLWSFGLELSENARLADIYDLMVGFIHIGDTEDEAGILSAASSDDSPFGKFAEMLQLVTDQPACHWENILDTVRPEVITKIVELVKENINQATIQEDNAEEYLQKMRIYADYLDEFRGSLAVFKMLDGIVLGSPFETYINSGAINDLFDGNEMPRLAMELYGMALISVDYNTDPLNGVRTIIEKYVSDTARIVKINAEMNRINAGFVKFYQTAIAALRNGNEQV